LYTRKGDRGETSLYGAKRVAKDSPRVEAYGSIDELNSLLGVVISMSKDATTSASLREIQRMLFVAGADSATELSDKHKVPRISGSDIHRLEKMTDSLLENLPKLKNFILPGGSPVAANIQLSRAVCRRTERRLLTASRSEKMNPELLPFFNRLSSYLFNLSRWTNKKTGRSEDIWSG
jgi:cob(I)alamin adenosyltransferase